MKYGIKLVAYDPWFNPDEVRSHSWGFGRGFPFLRSPFLPLSLSEGIESVTDLPVDNGGDVEAWPVWKIAGPVKSFSIGTVPTSEGGAIQSFGIAALPSEAPVIEAGRTLTIDTRPGHKSAKDDAEQIIIPSSRRTRSCSAGPWALSRPRRCRRGQWETVRPADVPPPLQLLPTGLPFRPRLTLADNLQGGHSADHQIALRSFRPGQEIVRVSPRLSRQPFDVVAHIEVLGQLACLVQLVGHGPGLRHHARIAGQVEQIQAGLVGVLGRHTPRVFRPGGSYGLFPHQRGPKPPIILRKETDRPERPQYDNRRDHKSDPQ
ncbi:phage tail family protein [Kitasatospora sp. NBC_00070]|uniref:hypothetical protein n=1 Tax=Kitasatospora sp. NBC_00070 TaxID=2975962 RepID=UPI003246EA9C